MIGFSSTEGGGASGGSSPDADPDLAVRVDRACDAFEELWRAGKRPRIEDFLDGIAPTERPAFLRSLLDIEIGLTREESRRDYAARFPEQAGLIAELLADPDDAAR